MPASGFIVRDSEMEKLKEKDKKPLNKEELTQYMSGVGSLIWLSSIRMDIVFTVLYLSCIT